MARIVTVYGHERAAFVPIDMSLGRWLKISEALARRAHKVTMATNEPGLGRFLPRRLAPNLRRAPLSGVRWQRYDVVKTEFHVGWNTLERHGGTGHDFIIAKLGSVVGDRDQTGVFFRAEEREQNFRTQTRIAERARYVTLLTELSREVWRSCHGDKGRELLVPGGADARIPAAGPDPFPTDRRPVCVFAGNFYDAWSQGEVHETLVGKMNDLGRALRRRGVWFHVVGRGDASRFDRDAVVHHPAVPFDRSWDYLRAADVGVVLAFGPHMNHNESTKIYHYLRAGLPTVCEMGFPNQGLVTDAKLGALSPNGEMEKMAETVTQKLILSQHTWDSRVDLYDELLRREFG
jgi:hypothetical protein